MKPKESLSDRGILQAKTGRNKFKLSRYEPCPELQPFVEHYWFITYDLPAGETFAQTVLSYPNFNLAFERDEEGSRSLLYGVPSLPFVRELRGKALVLGIKFRAGGQYPFYSLDAIMLTGKTIDVTKVFGNEAEEWMNTVLDASDGGEMARFAENFLLAHLPERDKLAELTDAIIQNVKNDRDLIRVEQISEQYNLSIRQLQRLFRKYVGVSPKWIIKRFRLQEAAELAERDEEIQWTELAEQLGYFDQAHFIKDFKSVIGHSPSDYRKHLLMQNITILL